MARKTEVIRVTQEESKMINVLREVGVNKLIGELKTFLNDENQSKWGISMPTVLEFIDKVDSHGNISLDDYVREGIITLTDKRTIINSIEKGENIAIIGELGSGKTTFCKALISEMIKMGINAFVYETSKEIEELNRGWSNKTNSKNINYLSSGNLNELLSVVLRYPKSYTVFGEIRNSHDFDALLMSLTAKPTIFSMAVTNMEGCSLRFYDNTTNKKFERSTKGNTLVVKCSLDKNSTERRITISENW